MLSGMERAVGPVQPGERPSVAPYACQVSMLESEAEPCRFALYDAGTGRMFVECTTHSYAVMAVDWTAPQFGGGMSLVDHLRGMRERFTRLGQLTGARVDDTVPSHTQSRFDDVFSAIERNLDATIVAVAGREEGNGAGTEADRT